MCFAAFVKLALLKSVLQCSSSESHSLLGVSLPYCRLVLLSLSNVLEMKLTVLPNNILGLVWLGFLQAHLGKPV